MNPATNLTPHFRLSEFIRSATAEARGIDNTPPDSVIVRLIALCIYVLEPLRAAVGHPIVITSGYRCPALNAAVGGVAGSQHMLGEAADIRCLDLAEVEALIAALNRVARFDQAIIERTSTSSAQAPGTVWLHVSCKFDPTQNRRQTILDLAKK